MKFSNYSRRRKQERIHAAAVVEGAPHGPRFIGASRRRYNVGRRRGTLTVLVCLASIVVGMAAAVGSIASDSAKRGGVLTIGFASPPSSLDPAKDNYNYQSLMRYLSNEPIMKFKQNGSLVPGLATSFGFVGKGNRAYQFTLRKNARFSDGTLVTAAAVKAWFTYYAKAGGYDAKGIPIRSITTPDKWTVRLNLSSASPNVPFRLAGQNWGFVSGPRGLARPASLGTETHGAGPYMLTRSETVSGDHYTFVPNKFYYDQSKIKFDKIVVKIISSPASMLQAAKTGQVDIAIGDATTAGAASSAGLNVYSDPAGWVGVTFTDLGGTKPESKPLTDRRVRQALNYAIDRKAIANAMLGKYAEPTSEWTTVDGWNPAYQNYYAYNPVKAKQLLSEAGYGSGFTLRVVDQGYSGNLGDPAMQAAAKYLSAVGVKLDITTEATSGAWLSKALGGDFPAFLHAWGSAPTLVFYEQILKPKGAANPHGWKDPVLEKLAAQGMVAPSDKASTYWKRISQRTVTEAHYLMLFTFPHLVYASKKIGGVSVGPYFLFSPAATNWFPKS